MKKKKLRKVILSLFLIVCAFFLLYFGYKGIMKEVYPKKYTELVEESAAKNDLPEELVYAVIRAESGFDEKAVSHVGARGLMQMMPDTFEWIQKQYDGELRYDSEDLFRPEINISYGCRLLRILLDRYGDTVTALCAYNAGVGNADKWIEEFGSVIPVEEIPFSETKQYVKKILYGIDQYKKLYQ